MFFNFMSFSDNLSEYNSCSQNLITSHPERRKRRLFFLSRTLFWLIFFLQYARLLLGIRQCNAHPCQKQPSTNTAKCCLGKTKSGFPVRDKPRRHPLTPCFLKILIIRNSVERLPFDLTFDITCDRIFGVTESMEIQRSMIVLGRLLMSFLSRRAFVGILAAWRSLLKSVSPWIAGTCPA